MKRLLSAFVIGVLYYVVFHLVLSAVFEGKIIPASNTIFLFDLLDWCCMWLCLFASCLRVLEDIIDAKFFSSKVDRQIRQIVFEHIDLINKYNRPDLFADELVNMVKEEREKMRNKKDD